MTISLVLFSARHCLFPARFRLAYYRALLLSHSLLCPLPPLLLTVFRQVPPSSFFPRFNHRELPARFLAGLSQLRSVCLRRASVRRPTACPSVDGYRFQFSSFRRSTGFFVYDNCSESGLPSIFSSASLLELPQSYPIAPLNRAKPLAESETARRFSRSPGRTDISYLVFENRISTAPTEFWISV